MGSARWLVSMLLVGHGCSRDPEPEPRAGLGPAPISAANPRLPLREPLAERIVAIGDLHGDLEATRAALRLAGAIDERDHWIGGKLVVVQTGDQIDRGDDDRKVIDALEALANEAKKAGGALYALNGNHETMNAQGDFRYVTPGGFRAFAQFQNASEIDRPELRTFKGLERGRAAAFLSGGSYAMKLASHPTILVLGDNVFVHGGVSPEHVRYGIERINREVTSFLRGEIPSLPPFLQRDDSPMWTRVYSSDPLAPAACQRLGQALEAIGARRLIVGHTVQPRGINSACEDRVWRIDVGLARYYGGPREVLEIHGRKLRVLGR
jgi:hypothetical protein